MKKILLSITLVSCISYVAMAQSISGQLFVQHTVLGLQKGYGVRYQTSKGIGIGVMYQSNGLRSSSETGANNYPFYGLEALVPIGQCNKTQFFLTPKVGLVNDRFLVVLPEVETQISISNTFSAGITAGLRARQSAVGAKIIATF